jgi:hypothetical protein
METKVNYFVVVPMVFMYDTPQKKGNPWMMGISHVHNVKKKLLPFLR